MTRPSVEVWEAQRPAAGFADRVVAAVLEDRAKVPRRRPTTARPWVLLAAAACVLVAGGAWGWTALPRSSAPVDRQPPVVLVERADPAPSAAQGRSFAPAAAVEVAPVGPLPVPSKRAAPVASTRPPLAAPPMLRSVPNPPCNCNAFACECGPE